MLAPLGLSLSIFLPKSPQFLVDNGKDSKAKEVIEQIADFNGYALPNKFYIKKEDEEEEKTYSESKLQYFKSIHNFMKLLLFTVLLSY